MKRTKGWPRTCALCWRTFHLHLPWYMRRSVDVDMGQREIVRVTACRRCYYEDVDKRVIEQRQLRIVVDEFVRSKSGGES